TLVAAAIVLALVSNAFASRDRQMKLVGFYPNAQKVPAREEPVAAPAAVAPVATTASQPPVTGSQLPVATTTQAPPTTTATVNRQPATPPAPSTQHPAPAPPAEDPPKNFNERSDPAQQALPIVVYCSGGDCEDSHMLAQKLYGALFNNVYVYKDGFPDWQKRGGAVHTGVEP